MRDVGVLTAGLLALLAVAACASESGQPIATATAAPSQPVATLNPDTNTPTAPSKSSTAPSALPTSTATNTPTRVSTSAEPSASLQENVALLGYGRASAKGEFAHLAIDGDPDSAWNSQRVSPQWLSIVLDNLYLVDKIELVITQAPAGPTTHEVWLGNGSGARTPYKRFINVHTEDGQTVAVAIEPPRIINEVLIRTVHSPSWVAWREVRVFGSSSASPLKLNEIVAGLERPVQVTHAGDSSGRLFVVEQKGRIRIIKDGAIDDAPFLDISDRVRCCGEQGLLNVAFPPAYAAKRHFYVNYTNTDGDTIISRYTTTADPDRADPDSEEVVLTIDQPFVTHNGGHMAFGPQDGYLYIGNGDGDGRIGNIDGQDPGALLGKMLRIDVESGVKPYSIPASNPYTQTVGYRGEIWALGLRNPWGFAFDKQTGDLYIPDAGSTKREEVNYQPASSAGGENYGWPIMEGRICFEHLLLPCSADGLVQPVAEYDSALGCVIVGGAVYRGTRYPRMQGAFLYADFCRGRIWGLKRPGQDGQDEWESALLISSSVPLSSIGQDEEGNMYVTGYQDGVVYMLTER